MTARTPLPSTLAAGAFTTAELHASGLPWRRTLAADLARICRGVHTAGIPDPCAPDGAAALVRLTGGVVSHVSAALWHGLPLPPRLARPKPQQQQLPRQASSAPAARGSTALAVRAEPAHHHISEAEANIEPKRLSNGDMVTVLTVKDSMCKWPIGDPADASFGFCGHGSAEGSPYCAEHARVAFQPAKKRERRAREFDYIQKLAS